MYFLMYFRYFIHFFRICKNISILFLCTERRHFVFVLNQFRQNWFTSSNVLNELGNIENTVEVNQSSINGGETVCQSLNARIKGTANENPKNIPIDPPKLPINWTVVITSNSSLTSVVA